MNFIDKLHPSLQTPGDGEPNWAYFIAMRDEEGQHWAERYSLPEHVEIARDTTLSLKNMRRNYLEEGLRLLEKVDRMLQLVEQDSPDIGHVLRRWYYGALAYYFYCKSDFVRAEEALDVAHEEIRQAIECKSFLLPLAQHCFDLCIQRARIVRNQRLWDEMWKRVEIARQTAVGERPYCLLDNGTAIDLDAVQKFYLSFEVLSDEERKSLSAVLDEDVRNRNLQQSLTGIYAISGFVIPYLPGSTAV